MIPAVAMLVFNRPEVTARVFAEVAKAKPARLYIIADGARAGRPQEAAAVAATRAVFDAIDWPCDVKRNFADANMGCRRRVVSGINWLFEHEEEAIILEDDCLPAPAFFDYCADMLARYRDDRRIFSVSGSNFARNNDEPAHFMSQYALMWGWATWRDRWARYVAEPDDADAILWRCWRRHPIKLLYWRSIFRRLQEGAFDTWDYQWILTVWRHHGLCCRPTVNLVENIGFGDDATHTKISGPLDNLPTYRDRDSFARRVGPVAAADPKRDAVDERVWLQLSTKTIVALLLPQVVALKHRLAGAAMNFASPATRR